jgi:gliding motility-associated-like protein
MRPVCRVAAIAVLILLLFQSTNAQLCKGSLGDPIVNITFGSGSNPGKPLAAATTSYQYVGNDCPNDGFYTVRNSTANCFNGSWHAIAADHTGNTNGYFMLVNATYQPGAFYLETVRGLCSNTTFEFAAWVTNVHRPSACSGNGIQPNLTFTIEKTDGTVLSTYNTGNIPPTASPTWQQVGFFFTTPVGNTEVVLRMVNNAPGGCGNDIALDDITLRPCGPDITASIVGETSTSLSFCEGEARNYTLTGTVMAGYTNPSLQWQQNIDSSGWVDIPGATATTLATDFPATMKAGTYLYRLSAAEAGNMGSPACRTASNPISFIIGAKPYANAGPDKSILEGDAAHLEGEAKGGDIEYSWSPVLNMNNAHLLNPEVTPPTGTDYILTVVSKLGCGTATDTMHVFVYKDIFVPNAFSPNKDGINDSWNIPALRDLPNADVRVFNRYGQLVFHTRNTNSGWNGKFNGTDQPIGTYVYLINIDHGKRILKGPLMLVR